MSSSLIPGFRQLNNKMNTDAKYVDMSQVTYYAHNDTCGYHISKWDFKTYGAIYLPASVYISGKLYVVDVYLHEGW